MHALAVVRVPFAKLVEVLGTAEGPEDAPADGAWVTTPQGPIAVTPLDDGAVVRTGVSAATDPEELGVLLRVVLGDLADAHDDERGVLVIPERARGDASTYAALVEDAADLGDWIELPVAAEGGLEAMMGQVAAMMGNDPSQMEGLWSQAQQLMANPDTQARLMEAAQAMMGQMQSGKGLDFGALAQQARQVIDQDPELLARMQAELGESDDD